METEETPPQINTREIIANLFSTQLLPSLIAFLGTTEAIKHSRSLSEIIRNANHIR